MSIEFETTAAKYIMEWGEWIEKLQLLAILKISRKKAGIYLEKLIKLQNSDGGFPVNWRRGSRSGIIETAVALEALSNLKADRKIVLNAVKFLEKKQLPNGSWMEENEERNRRVEPTIITAKVIRGIAAYDKKRSCLEKAIRYLMDNQRTDGLWLSSSMKNESSLEASSEALIALLEVNNPKIEHALKFGIDALWSTFMEKFTEEWREPSKEALHIAEALIKAGYGDAEAVKKILQSYVKAERWRFGDRRSISTDEAVDAIRILILAGAIDAEVIKKVVEELLDKREKLKAIIEKKEEDVRNYFLIRFEEIGLRINDEKRKILLGCFIYALLDQFFWAAEDFDPQSEYRRITGIIGPLNQLENYAEIEKVRGALFRSRVLRGIARRRKMEVARSIVLFTKFLKKYGENGSFREFAEKLRAYTLFELGPQITGWNASHRLGLLLRSFSKGEKSLPKLYEALKLSLECFPAVGSKIATLFSYYSGWIFNLWPEIKKYIECPIDWNTVKPYGNIGLSCLTIEELKKDPKKTGNAIKKLSRELFPDDPAKISFLWVVGHEWCTKPYKCYGNGIRKCWLIELCRGERYEKREKNMG